MSRTSCLRAYKSAFHHIPGSTSNITYLFPLFSCGEEHNFCPWCLSSSQGCSKAPKMAAKWAWIPLSRKLQSNCQATGRIHGYVTSVKTRHLCLLVLRFEVALLKGADITTSLLQWVLISKKPVTVAFLFPGFIITWALSWGSRPPIREWIPYVCRLSLRLLEGYII